MNWRQIRRVVRPYVHAWDAAHVLEKLGLPPPPQVYILPDDDVGFVWPFAGGRCQALIFTPSGTVRIPPPRSRQERKRNGRNKH